MGYGIEQFSAECRRILKQDPGVEGRKQVCELVREVLKDDSFVATYLTADLRLAWSPRKNLEVAIVGRNLFDEAHPEFRTMATAREVERSVFATFKWSY